MVPATILRSTDSGSFEFYGAFLDQIKPIRRLALMKDDRAFLNMNPACTARENSDVPIVHPFKKRKCGDVVC